ncbi:MAG: ATP-binding protein [Crocinitomicaceae bacterium]|nr:ATP-binding protein [Crocinitomicaceae bacterium]
MLSIEIASKLEKIHEVESLVDKVSAEMGLSEDHYGNVLIAVTEAVNNAIIHGNKYSNDKSVVVSVAKGDKEIIFTVSDKGSGFDFNNLPDPTSPENIEKPDGRGIFLMKNLSDGVAFENAGSTVRITFAVANV